MLVECTVLTPPKEEFATMRMCTYDCESKSLDAWSTRNARMKNMRNDAGASHTLVVVRPRFFQFLYACSTNAATVRDMFFLVVYRMKTANAWIEKARAVLSARPRTRHGKAGRDKDNKISLDDLEAMIGEIGSAC
jgi:hypothetical protein